MIDKMAPDEIKRILDIALMGKPHGPILRLYR